MSVNNAVIKDDSEKKKLNTNECIENVCSRAQEQSELLNLKTCCVNKQQFAVLFPCIVCAIICLMKAASGGERWKVDLYASQPSSNVAIMLSANSIASVDAFSMINWISPWIISLRKRHFYFYIRK